MVEKLDWSLILNSPALDSILLPRHCGMAYGTKLNPQKLQLLSQIDVPHVSTALAASIEVWVRAEQNHLLAASIFALCSSSSSLRTFGIPSQFKDLSWVSTGLFSLLKTASLIIGQ